MRGGVQVIGYRLEMNNTHFQTNTETSVKTMDRAAKAMDTLHGRALNMNRAWESSSAQQQRFARVMDTTSMSLGRAATAAGLPAGALSALGVAAGVAELKFSNLKTAAVGLNVATAGVVAGGLALGTMLGGWARQLGETEFGMKALGLSTRELDRDMARLYRTIFGGGDARGFGPAERAQHAQNAARAAGLAQVADLDKIRLMRSGGMTVAQIRDELAIQAGTKLRDTAQEQALQDWEKQEEAAEKSLRKQEAAARQWAEEQKRATKAAGEAWLTFFGVLRSMSDDFDDMLRTQSYGLNTGFSPLPGIVSERQQSADRWSTMVGIGVSPDDMRKAVVNQEIVNQKFKETKDTTREAAAATFDWSNALSEVRAGLQLLGIEADSVFGRIIGALSVIGKALDTIRKGGSLNIGIGALGIVGAGFSIGQAIGRWIGGDPRATAEEQQKRRDEIAAAEEKARAEAFRIHQAALGSRAAGATGIMEHGPAFFEGLGPGAGRHYGALFAAAWAGVVKEKGIIAAADAFRDVFERMRDEFAAMPDFVGGGTGGLPGFLQDIGLIMDLSLDDEFRALAEAARTAASFLKALAEAGVLGPEAMQAMETRALELFGAAQARAIELGKSPAEAERAGFAVISPLLQELVDQAILQNQTLTPEVQALVDKSGIVPGVHFQQLDELRAIRAAVQKLAGIAPGAGVGAGAGTGAGGGVGGGGGIPHDKPEKKYQHGGWVDVAGTVEPGEFVISKFMQRTPLGSYAASVLGGRTSSTASGLAAVAPSISVNQPVTVSIGKLGKGADDDVDALGEELARQVAAGRHPLIRALQNQGFRRN